MARRARREAVSALALVLPHPELPRRRSSLLSQNSVSSPRTPRNSGCGSPRCQSWLVTSNTGNRKSTDSWNSSNYDIGEDCDAEWKPEQVLLLSRTLDALPAHLTPFNGPIPPSNLLDKIARGVANAKGPAEWPHSLRATRVKLIELARQRAKEDQAVKYARACIDENDDIGYFAADSDVNLGLGRKSSMGIRRPLYRQSSMDFMNTDDRKINGADSITRLSTRLQRTENIIPNNSYHPYTRSRARAQTQTQTQAHHNKMNRRSSSPPRPGHVPSLISPSTPSSSTLSTLSSLSTSAARPHLLRRSASTLTSSDVSMHTRSSIADSSVGNLLPSAVTSPVDARVQRIRRAESFCAPSPNTSFISTDGFPFPIVSAGTPPPTRQSFKRAPSYGTLAREARDREKERRSSGVYHHIREEMNSSPIPSSDEEEKIRDKQAKKARMPGFHSSKAKVAAPDSTPKETPKKSKKDKVTTCTERSGKKKASQSQTEASSSAATGARPLRMNLQRNPSMFGDELPHLHIPSPSMSSAYPPSTTANPPATPSQRTSTPSAVPTDPQRKVKTLRRVKRLGPSRKISFGSLVATPDDAATEDDGDGAGKPLGSAFQLA
ncbi:hypothetical protein WG66_016916 [Moniliophthora roreri]|uniref:Uncharacterized protein n=1 Tax=Moniliophthora roreri TaxID=221103 RepID=A0A0W0FMP4_MONRR|nr:hypothetical protein WG66_016916 [Moniliophthora roreri]